MTTECQRGGMGRPKKAPPHDPTRPPFAAILSELMRRKRFGVETLSKKAHVPKSTISRWSLNGTKGGPRLYEVVRVADILGVTIDQLLGRQAIPPAQEGDDLGSLSSNEVRLIELYRDREQVTKGVDEILAEEP